MKKFTSVLLSLLMVISMITVGAVSVSAVDTEEAAGSVTSEQSQPAEDAPVSSITEQTGEDAPESYTTEQTDEGTATTPEGGSAEAVQTAATVAGIEIVSLPYVTEYPAGTEVELTYELSGLAVEVLYSDGSSEIYDYDLDWDFFESAKFSGANVSREVLTVQSGENTVKLAYKGKTATFVLNGVTVTGIEVLSEPDYRFVTGNSYAVFIADCLDGMSVRVTYGDGTSRVYSYDDYEGGGNAFYYTASYSGACFEEWDFQPVAGENKVTITYGGQSAEFSVYAVDVTDLEIVSLPDRTEYFAGQGYDFYNYCLEGFSVKVTYSDGTSEIYEYDDYDAGWELITTYLEFEGECINYSELTYSYDLTPVPGENVITVSYGGKSAEMVFTGREVASLEIITEPEAYKLIAGGEYGFTDYLFGASIQLTYADGETAIFSYYDDSYFYYYDLSYDINGEACSDSFSIFNEGENVVTVSCGGASDSFTVNAVGVTSLEVITPPDEQILYAYNEYDMINCLDGLVLQVTYRDGTTEQYACSDRHEDGSVFTFYCDTLSYSIHGDELSVPWVSFVPEPGENTVTLSIGELSCDISLNAVEVTGMEIVTPPDAYRYVAGVEYYISDYLSGIEFSLELSDGTSAVYSYDDWENGGYEFCALSVSYRDEDFNYESITLKPGENVITAEFAGASASFVINAVEVTKLQVTGNPSAFVIAGCECNFEDCLAGLTVEAEYSDGSTAAYAYEDIYDDYEAYEFFNGVSYSGDCFNGYDTYQAVFAPGENTVTMTCGNADADFVINAKEVASFEITQPPYQTEYIAGSYQSAYSCLYGTEITLTFTDGTSGKYLIGEENIFTLSGDILDEDGFFITEPGENIITVSCGEFSGDVVLTGIEITGIKITKQPDTTEYIANNTRLSYSVLQGMEVEVTFADGGVRIYSTSTDGEFFAEDLLIDGDCAEEGYITLQPGENLLTISCGGGSDELILTGKEVTAIEVTRLPDVTEFIAANSVQYLQYLDGLEVRLTFADGTTRDYTARDNNKFFTEEVGLSSPCIDFMGYLYPEAGENVITLTCGAAEAQYAVTGLEPESVEITKQPDVTELNVGEKYYITSCLDGMEITVTFTDGTVRVYAFDDVENGGRDFFYYNLYYGKDDGQITSFVPVAGENEISLICGEAISTLTFTGVESGEKLPGDVNGDGKYDIRDAAAIQLYKARLYIGEFDESVADVNGDGVIDVRDAAYIQLDLAKLL